MTPLETLKFLKNKDVDLKEMALLERLNFFHRPMMTGDVVYDATKGEAYASQATVFKNKALELVAEVMTSGIKQEGATFTLPESMIIELVQRAKAQERAECYDLLIKLRNLPDAGMTYAAELIRTRREK